MERDQTSVCCGKRNVNKLSTFVRAKEPCKFPGEGREIRRFGPSLLVVWDEFKHDALEIHKVIIAMLKLHVEMEKLWNVSPAMPAKRFHDCLGHVAHMQCLLYDRFVDEPGSALSAVASKFHSVVRIASLAAFLNSQNAWRFAEKLCERWQVLFATMLPWCKHHFAPATID